MKNTRFITGDERLRIQKTLEGPMGISLKKGGGASGFYYGFPQISLSIADTDFDICEFRSIYANIWDKNQSKAIVRSSYWNRQHLKKFYTPNIDIENVKVDVSYKYCHISNAIELIRNSSSIKFSFNGTIDEDSYDHPYFKSFRIIKNLNRDLSSFLWRAGDESLESLERYWLDTWKHFDHLLQQNDIVDINYLEEDFYIATPINQYKFMNSLPLWNTFP